MKKYSAMVMALALLLMSSPQAYPQTNQTTTSPPPVASTLVREGDFATALVSALDIGTAENEMEAETMLASAGIAPKNGWISDYPVTPDILGELQDAVVTAADSNRLTMDKDEALEVLESVSADLGLYVLADTSGGYVEVPAPVSPQYTEPTVINNYYYTEGPPVVTYYPPPPDYLYLYSWVSYPFWCSRFFFSGYFILNDFHKVSRIHRRVVVVSNHGFHRHHRRFYKIDPVKRRWGRSFGGKPQRVHKRVYNKAEVQRGARAILQRSHERMRAKRRLVNKSGAALKSLRGSRGRTRTEIGQQRKAFRGLTGVRAQNTPRPKVQKLPGGTARVLRGLGGGKGRSVRQPAIGKRGFSGGLPKGGKRFNRKLSGNTGRALKALGGSKGRSVRQPAMAKRGFSGGSLKGGKRFSGKGSSKALRGFVRKGTGKLPF